MISISSEYQRNLIIQIALHRLTRISISRETGISEYTLRKILDSPTPVSVNNSTFKTLDKWFGKLLANDKTVQV